MRALFPHAASGRARQLLLRGQAKAGGRMPAIAKTPPRRRAAAAETPSASVGGRDASASWFTAKRALAPPNRAALLGVAVGKLQSKYERCADPNLRERAALLAADDDGGGGSGASPVSPSSASPSWRTVQQRGDV